MRTIPVPLNRMAKRRRMLTRSEIVGLSEGLRTLLASVEGGDLDASAALRHRIEGAITALDAVLGSRSSLDFVLDSPAEERQC